MKWGGEHTLRERRGVTKEHDGRGIGGKRNG